MLARLLGSPLPGGGRGRCAGRRARSRRWRWGQRARSSASRLTSVRNLLVSWGSGRRWGKGPALGRTGRRRPGWPRSGPAPILGRPAVRRGVPALVPWSAKNTVTSCSNSSTGPAPGSSSQAVLVRDRVDGAGAPPGALGRAAGQPRRGELLRFLVQLADRPWPEPARASGPSAGSALSRPRLDREQAEVGVEVRPERA